MKRIIQACFAELSVSGSQNNADLFVMRPRYSGRKNRVDSINPQKNGTVLGCKRHFHNNSVLLEEA